MRYTSPILLAVALVFVSCGGASRQEVAPAGGEVGRACDARDPAELMSCVEQDRYVADLEVVAAKRPPGSEHHAA
ncbi:MAG: hypothetical protein JRF63_14345, partial [Deltaproteobacteria bacterium]|nr:hypothetical protein [Deltaproteobacteria bacterium]